MSYLFLGVRNLIEDKDVNASAILRVVALFALKFGAQNEQTLRSLSASACQAKHIERKEFDAKIRGIRDYSSGLQVQCPLICINVNYCLNYSFPIWLMNNSVSIDRRVFKWKSPRRGEKAFPRCPRRWEYLHAARTSLPWHFGKRSKRSSGSSFENLWSKSTSRVGMRNGAFSPRIYCLFILVARCDLLYYRRSYLRRVLSYL